MFRRFSQDFSKLDRKQLATFTSETLLLVNYSDVLSGTIDKLTSHSWPHIKTPEALPHRAYSIFVFNSQNKLLLQQRSHKKVTWPMFWSNTCCSHPMSDAPLATMKQEVIARTKYELGFDIMKLIPDQSSVKLVGKIIYKAKYDEDWGEYELDYLFFVKQNVIEVEGQIAANSEEINSVKWVGQDELDEALASKLQFTPWFRSIVGMSDFGKWWRSLDSLQEVKEPKIQILKHDA